MLNLLSEKQQLVLQPTRTACEEPWKVEFQMDLFTLFIVLLYCCLFTVLKSGCLRLKVDKIWTSYDRFVKPKLFFRFRIHIRKISGPIFIKVELFFLSLKANTISSSELVLLAHPSPPHPPLTNSFYPRNCWISR